MGFNIGVFPNPFLKVNGLGFKQRYLKRLGNLAVSTTEIVLDTKKPIKLDYLEFVTNDLSNTRLLVRQYENNVAVGLGLLTYAGTETSFSVSNLVRDGSAIVRFELYDTTNNRYKISVTGIEFPEGCQIGVVNNSSTVEYIGAVVLRYREME